MHRLGMLVVLGVSACGGRGAGTAAATPQTMEQAVTRFLDAVKANDLNRMGQLWGTERGPAAGTMKPTELSQRLAVIQKYLAHTGSRVLDGPIAVPGNDRLRTFRVELQRPACSRVVPIDLIQTRAGGWIVYDVHLEAAGNPMLGCQPGGTRR